MKREKYIFDERSQPEKEKEEQIDLKKLTKEIVPQEIAFCYGPNGDFSELLSEGIININRKMYLAPDASPIVLSLYLENAEEMIGREFKTREIIGKTIAPTQKIIYSGNRSLVGREDCGFIIKEFKEGITLNDVLTKETEKNIEDQNIKPLLFDLGRYLNALGSIKLERFGKIKKEGVIAPLDNCSWEQYYFHELNENIQTLKDLKQNKKIEEQTVKRVLKLIPALTHKASKQPNILNTVSEPRFVHHDFHFLNIIADYIGKELHISGILDLENATSGDPEFDLVSIESQLILTPEYKDLFMANVESFRSGYQKNVSKGYQQKRWLYHLIWSLSYFSAVMQMDTKIHPITNQVKKYMQHHCEILEGLVRGEIIAPSLF